MIARLQVPTLALALTLAGCAPPPPTLSPAGQAAVIGKQVIQALDVLRDFAISANAQTPPLLSTANTRKIIDYHESAVKVIEAAPSGWKATVLAGLDQLKVDLPPADWLRILPYVALVKSLIAGVA
jgi:hypothetical protein